MKILVRFGVSLLAGIAAVAIMVAIRKFIGIQSQALTGAVGAIAFMLTWATMKLVSSR